MSSTPELLAAYYADYPRPPQKPPLGAPLEERLAYSAALSTFEQQRAAYEAANGPPPPPAEVPPLAAAIAGRPAARLGDLTTHGGAITGGCPTVIMGGKPAARVTDMHVCAMVSGVVPHVGGPLLPPGGLTVIIGGLPAARLGDAATCAGGPDALAQGEPTILIG